MRPTLANAGLFDLERIFLDDTVGAQINGTTSQVHDGHAGFLLQDFSALRHQRKFHSPEKD